MENYKRPREDLEGECSSKKSRRLFLLKQLIPHHVSGVIIGSAGATIIALQKTTDTQIKLSRNNDFYPGTFDRVLVITGNADNVKEAHNTIWTKIYQKSDQNLDLKVNLVLPHVVIGVLIGKNGTQIKKIKESTGANIHITPKSDNPRLLERVVTITGATSQQSNDAFDQIFQILKEEPNSSLYPNENYAEIMNFSPSKLTSSSLTVNPYTHSYGGMNVPNFMSCSNMINPMSIISSLDLKSQKTLEAVRLMLRGAGFIHQCIDEIVLALVILKNYGLLPGDDLNALPVNFDTLSALMKGVTTTNCSYNNSLEASDSNQSYSQSVTLNSSSLSPPPSMTQNGNMTQVSDIMHVNESLVGAILGPAGRNLIEIQRSTQTNIVISKKKKVPTANMR